MSPALAFVLAAATLGPAEPPAEPPPAGGDAAVEALVREACERNPEVRAALEAVTAAWSRPPQARALPDPMLSLTYENDGWAPSLGEQPMTRLGVMWSQELPWSGKRDLRGRIAESEGLQAQQQLERVQLSLAAKVRRAYTELVLSRRQLELVREEQEIWRQIEGVARARYAVGQGAQQDVLRVQIEVTRTDQQRIEQELQADVRLAELNGLLARPPQAPLDTPGRLAPVRETRDLATLLAWVAERSPELRAGEAAVERERLAVALAQKDFKPDFAVQAGYMNRGGLEPMWQAGVSAVLPIYRKKRELALLEAEAQLRQAEARLESLRLQLRFRTQERAARLRSIEQVASLYEKGVVPQGQMSVEAAVANYQAGKVPFIAVLEALRTLYQDRTTQLQLVATHAKTAASLHEASLDGGDAEVPLGKAAGFSGALYSAAAGMPSKGMQQ